MHLVLAVPSTDPRAPRGELWLGGIAASGQVSVLHQNGIGVIVVAAAKPPVACDHTVRFLGCLDGTGVSTGTVPMESVIKTFKLMVSPKAPNH